MTHPELALYDDAEPRCGVEWTLTILDGKWTTMIMRELLGGPRRFGQLRDALSHTTLGSPSPKTLTERLRILEHHAILTRTVHAEVPPRVVYELTDRGRSLEPVLLAMLAWGDADRARSDFPLATG